MLFQCQSRVILERMRWDLQRLLGQTMRPGEVDDVTMVVAPMVDLTLVDGTSRYPRQEASKEAADAHNTPMGVISGILRTARIAELSSFGRIADRQT